MITGGDLRQSRLDVGYKTFTISPWERIEVPHAVSARHPTSRYSLVQCLPLTGRKHQIRRHLAHLRHPIVGDTSHGDGKHNRFFREQFGCDRLMLHHHQLAFRHPHSNEMLTIKATLDERWQQRLKEFGWSVQI